MSTFVECITENIKRLIPGTTSTFVHTEGKEVLRIPPMSLREFATVLEEPSNLIDDVYVDVIHFSIGYGASDNQKHASIAIHLCTAESFPVTTVMDYFLDNYKSKPQEGA